MKIEPIAGETYRWLVVSGKTNVVELDPKTGNWCCSCEDYHFKRRFSESSGYYPRKDSQHCKHINLARNTLLDSVIEKIKEINK